MGKRDGRSGRGFARGRRRTAAISVSFFTNGAHLNFSNSQAFHFPDGRSSVRTTRLLRTLVSFAGFSRLTMASRFETFGKKFSIAPGILHSLTSSSSSCSLRPRRCLVRRRELSRCEPGLKLSPYIRSSFSSSSERGIWHWLPSSGLVLPLFPVRSLVTTKRVHPATSCSLFSNRSHFYILFSSAILFISRGNGYVESHGETNISVVSEIRIYLR